MTDKDTIPHRSPTPAARQQGKTGTRSFKVDKTARNKAAGAYPRPLSQETIDQIMGAAKAESTPEQRAKAAVDNLLQRSGKYKLRGRKGGHVLFQEIKEGKEQEDEGLLNETLKQYFRERDVAPELWDETAAEIERVIRKKIAAGQNRPLWDDRARYPELANLSAPEFLKRVWADQIGADGVVVKDDVRGVDRSLMARVDVYLATRERRNQDAGDAAGLHFVARSTRPKRARDSGLQI